MAFSVLMHIKTFPNARLTPTNTLPASIALIPLKEWWGKRALFNTINLRISSDLSSFLLGLFLFLLSVEGS